MKHRYTIWAGKPLADQPARPGRPAATGRHAQTFARQISGTMRDAMAIAERIPDDDNHTLVTVDRYDGFDRILREHKTSRVAKRVDGVWIVGVTDVAEFDERAKQARLAAAGA